MSSTYTLYNAQQGHKALSDLWAVVKPYLIAGHRLQVTVRKEKRTEEQNRLMWAALTDVANQVDWHGQKLTKDEWKDVFTASLKRQKVVPGLDGGFVVLGTSTRKMSKEEMSELLELTLAFGAQHGVTFHEG